MEVIDAERRGKYLGKTVQLIPHVVEHFVKMVEKAGEGKDIVVVEIGGVVGDYENVPFLVGARLMGRKHRTRHVLVVYFPVPSHLGEMKSKPAQHSIRHLLSFGIVPDVVVGRAERPIDEPRKEKIEQSTGIPSSSIVSLPDLENIYEAPLYLWKEGLGKILGMNGVDLGDWEERLDRLRNPHDDVRVALVGKYIRVGDFSLPDSYVSIKEALVHAWAETGIRPIIDFLDANNFDSKILKDYDAVLVPGGFGANGVEGKIEAARFARENDVPYLGLCYGMQLATVEFARNVLGWSDAHTTEVNPDTRHPVIDVIPEQREILQRELYGGTMRLGEYAAHLKRGTIVESLYRRFGWFDLALREEEAIRRAGDLFRIGRTPKPFIFERHRHRYEVNPTYLDELEAHGYVVAGYHVRHDGVLLVEFMEYRDHPFFVGTQPHPEFKSYFERPSPVFVGFLEAARR